MRVVPVGSGRALELARLGEADVVLSHAPALEERFVREGYARERLPVASSDYLLVGPKSDPARVGGAATAAEALRRIAAEGSPFISRGDGSGTRQKETELWAQAGIPPRGAWYESANAGMGAVLRLCGKRGGYTLVDRATFTTYRSRVGLAVFHSGTSELKNPYSLLLVSRGQGRGAHREAHRLTEFLTGAEGQQLIAGFGAPRFGEPLFVPAR